MVADFAPVHLVKRQFKAGDAETKMFILYIYICIRQGRKTKNIIQPSKGGGPAAVSE